MLDEDFDVDSCADCLRGIKHGLRLIDENFTHLSHDLRKLLHIFLDEVNLSDIVFLSSIKAIAVLVLNLVHALINHLDVATILIAGLASCQFRVIDLLLKAWLHERL